MYRCQTDADQLSCQTYSTDKDFRQSQWGKSYETSFLISFRVAKPDISFDRSYIARSLLEIESCYILKENLWKHHHQFHFNTVKIFEDKLTDKSIALGAYFYEGFLMAKVRQRWLRMNRVKRKFGNTGSPSKLAVMWAALSSRYQTERSQYTDALSIEFPGGF